MRKLAGRSISGTGVWESSKQVPRLGRNGEVDGSMGCSELDTTKRQTTRVEEVEKE